MIEMPVRVDQARDRIAAKTGKSSGDLRMRYANTGIDKHFAVGAGQVSAGALEYADIVSQLVRNDGRSRCAVLDQADDAARLRKCLARRKPSARCLSASPAYFLFARPQRVLVVWKRFGRGRPATPSSP